MRPDYKKQYLNPKWQKKRLEILTRDEFACVDCFDTESTLYVHHTYYENGKEFWDYPDDSLITLCAECHQVEEDLIKQYSDLFIETLRKSKFRPDHWRQLASGIKECVFHEPAEITAHAYCYAFSDPDMQKVIISSYLNMDKNNV